MGVYTTGFHLRSPCTSCFSTMYTPPSVRKQITVRALRRIKDDALAEDLDRF